LVIDNILQLNSKWLEYTVFDPDSDFAYKYHYVKPFNKGEEFFRSIPKNRYFLGRYGEKSAPFISVFDEIPENYIFHNSRINVWFPMGCFPTTVKVEYKMHSSNENFISKYTLILAELFNNGVDVNNSFVHVYSRKKEAEALDGGYCGLWTSFEDRKIINHSVEHRYTNCKNHVMDIFCANSIERSCLDNETLVEIKKIVGDNNCITLKDSIVFNLPDIERHVFLYRKRYWKKIQLLRKLLEI